MACLAACRAGSVDVKGEDMGPFSSPGGISDETYCFGLYSFRKGEFSQTKEIFPFAVYGRPLCADEGLDMEAFEHGRGHFLAFCCGLQLAHAFAAHFELAVGNQAYGIYRYGLFPGIFYVLSVLEPHSIVLAFVVPVNAVAQQFGILSLRG